MSRRATIDDIQTTALGMPHVTVFRPDANPVYRVGSKSFVFFRTPRPDAVDPESGDRYDDVIVFWVASEGEKLALVQDESTPFFTTPHFEGHPSVLLRGTQVAEVDRVEIVELVQDAWLAQASRRRAETWLREHQLGG